jgi:hypothetical protein
MKKLLRLHLASFAVATTLLFSGSAWAFEPQGAKSTKAASTATTAPTAQEIADAKAKGLVWVNTSTKVYHKDGQFYGTTKHGKFMTEADAQKAGYRAAQEPAASKKSTSSSKK